MKEPKSKLPWKYVNQETIVTLENKEVVGGSDQGIIVFDEDIEYILECCNNFPKAIELLEKLYSDTNEMNVEIENWREIKGFLKTLES